MPLSPTGFSLRGETRKMFPTGCRSAVDEYMAFDQV
jgi:hypothetical protein